MMISSLTLYHKKTISSTFNNINKNVLLTLVNTNELLYSFMYMSTFSNSPKNEV